MRSLRQIIGGLAAGATALGAALTWTPVAAVAQDRSMEIADFHANIVVAEDGDVVVDEVIQFDFRGSWNGIFRLIPVEYRTPQGFSYRLFLDVLNVTDEAGTPLDYELSRERHYRKIKIWVPGAVNTTKAVRIRYSASSALRFFEEHDELYWNVTGDEWEFPIRRASATVVLPQGVTGTRAASFTGGYGSKQNAATFSEIDSGFTFETTEALNFKEGLTVAVAWDPGVIARPTIADKVGGFLWANWMLVLPVLSFFLMYSLWKKRGRDPELRPIAPQYEPPEELRPAEVGTLVDNRPDMRDIISTIVDLAVRGYLRIEEVEPTGLLKALKSREYRFVHLKDESNRNELHEHERDVLDGLFDSGRRSEAKLSDLEHEFYKKLSGIKSGIFRRLMGYKFYDHRPDKVMRRYLIGGILVSVMAIPLGAGLAEALTMSPIAGVLGIGLSGIPIIIFGIFMPARTLKGARKLEEILGFREFLDRVESDRFKKMIKTPEMFEQYLPYAMALGVDEQWSKAFEDICKEPPNWYVGHGYRRGMVFHPAMFVSDLNSMTKVATTAMASQPRSSGGSAFGGGGFSGGGFSGGGFGGGGGGGF